TKSLVAAARTMRTVRGAARMGVITGAPVLDYCLLKDHKEGVVGGMVEAHRGMFRDSGMDFVLGTARFVGERTAEVVTAAGATRLVRGRDVVVNTGTEPAVPDLPGMAETEPWTSETILRLESFPDTLVVLGGGYVGCEFASVFALFGSEVTLLQGGDQLLPREDPDVAAAVAGVLADQGVDVRLDTRAASV